MPQQSNKRVERTQQLLMLSLLQLMAIQPYSKLSVAQLCQHSGVARPTFYSHYRSKDDLLRAYIGRMFEAFYAEVDPYLTRSIDADPVIATLMFQQWSDKPEESKVLMQADVEALIMVEFNHYVRRIIERFVHHHQLPVIDNERLNYVIDFLTGASFMVIARWIRQDFPITAADMGALYADLVRPGLLQVLLAGRKAQKRPA